jgi:hypothetical protein
MAWHKIIVGKKICVTFLELLYLSQSIPVCVIKEEYADRIEKRLKELCSKAASSCVGTVGNKRTKLLSATKSLAVYKHEVDRVDKLCHKIYKLETEKTNLEEQVSTLEEKCEKLLQEIVELHNNKQDLVELEQSFTKLEDENAQLQEYVLNLLERESCKFCDSSCKNKGNPYDKVSYTQKQRKLKELKTSAEKALWFIETCGLKLDSLSLLDAKGDKVKLQFIESTKKSAYNLLSEEEKDKIKAVVYIIDKFCVSDVAYHELSMSDPEGIPRSYLIKQCRNNLNEMCSISRTPGEWPGAQLSFKDELNYHLSKQV